LAAVSVQDLRPNPQDTAAFYLENIYRLLADPNISRVSILASPARPPPFSPPTYAIWVNSFWFLSLAISLTCALLATLLQQWARRYVTVTQPPRYSPHKRARIRAFFADGIEKLHLPWAVEALPTLLHVSLFLFFSGLLIFLLNVNYTVFSFVAWWVALSAGAYGCITLMPIFRHDSPYYAPLSSSAWFIYSGVSYGVFRILELIASSVGFSTWSRFHGLKITYRNRLLGGMIRTGQETASISSAEIDGRVLGWAFDALDEDHEVEEFFEGIPGFCNSKVVSEPRQILSKPYNLTLSAALRGFLDRTWSSSLLSETIKVRRLMVCMQAVDALQKPHPPYYFIAEFFEQAMGGVMSSVQIGHSLRLWNGGCRGDSMTCLYAQAIIAGIIARVSERDYRWRELVMGQLGISEDVLEDYLGYGDSLLLANLNHVIRQFLHFYLENRRASSALELIRSSISIFNIQDTLAELQYDFCALWNEITMEACDRDSSFDLFQYSQTDSAFLCRFTYRQLHQSDRLVFRR
jgi:Family of unknown function (DUF6535)